MLSWGLISGAMAFVTNPTGFYVLRFLLGVAEAGFSQVLFYISATGSPLDTERESLPCSWRPSLYRLLWVHRYRVRY